MAESEFDELMRTPSGLAVEDAARLYGLPFHRAPDLDSLATAFSAGDEAVSVIEVPVAG